MSQVVPESADSLRAELRTLIARSRQRLAGAVNAELTRLYWSVGERLRTTVLGGARASYGTQLLDQLGQQLAQEFGRGFESRNHAPHDEVCRELSRRGNCVNTVDTIELEPHGGHRGAQNPAGPSVLRPESRTRRLERA